MNTEYAVGNFRIHFESRTSRRRFVALVYAVLALFLLSALILNKHVTSGPWITAGCGILYLGLWIVFSWISGDPRANGDERETHRRDRAHFRAYCTLGFFLFFALMAGSFRGPDPITSHLPLALRDSLAQLPFFLLLATGLLYGTLPSAILLWTEPDMEEK
jgi:hypothetical protein